MVSTQGSDSSSALPARKAAVSKLASVSAEQPENAVAEVMREAAGLSVLASVLPMLVIVAASTPQSGFVCNILNHSHTTHRQGYWHVCVVSVIAPIVETLLLIPLCALFGLA